MTWTLDSYELEQRQSTIEQPTGEQEVKVETNDGGFGFGWFLFLFASSYLLYLCLLPDKSATHQHKVLRDRRTKRYAYSVMYSDRNFYFNDIYHPPETRTWNECKEALGKWYRKEEYEMWYKYGMPDLDYYLKHAQRRHWAETKLNWFTRLCFRTKKYFQEN